MVAVPTSPASALEAPTASAVITSYNYAAYVSAEAGAG